LDERLVGDLAFERFAPPDCVNRVPKKFSIDIAFIFIIYTNIFFFFNSKEIDLN
jgi:hypothetical protein